MKIQFPEGLQLAVQSSFNERVRPHIKVLEDLIKATLALRGLPPETKVSFDLLKIDGFDIADAPLPPAASVDTPPLK